MERAMNFLRQCADNYTKTIKTKDLAFALGINYNAALKILKTLKQEGILEHFKYAKYGWWEINLMHPYIPEWPESDEQYFTIASDEEGLVIPVEDLNEFREASMESLTGNWVMPTVRPPNYKHLDY